MRPTLFKDVFPSCVWPIPGRYERLFNWHDNINTFSKNVHEGTFLAMICSLPDTEGIVQRLLEYKADPNLMKSSYWDTNPLCVATPENTRLLLQYKADPNQQNEDGETPICCVN